MRQSPLIPPNASFDESAGASRGPRGAPGIAEVHSQAWIAHITPRVLWMATLALATALRFSRLGQGSLSFDEAWVVWIISHRWQELPSIVGALDFHPPGFYLLIKAWAGVAGTGEVPLRIPSACLSVFSVALTYTLARGFGSEAIALLSAFLMAVSPFEIMAAQEARMYPLLEALLLGSTLILLRGVRRGGWLSWAGYAVLVATAAYTQYMAALVFIGHGIWVTWYERRNVGRWLAATCVAGALFGPWMPWFWHQALHQSARAWIVVRPAFLDLGGLAGLLAFGGSLFGMAGYFVPGSLDPVENVIVLLPFLAIAWLGVRSLKLSDRRGLALLALAPAVTIATMWVVSWGRPIVYPRAFVFLHPYVAIALARGIHEAADRVRGSRERVAAWLVAGLLLYGVPVLAHYYTDPGFRPYQWRAAAAAVAASVRPGDVFLFAGKSAEIPFEYYFREPHPTLTLIATEAIPGPGQKPAFTPERARELAAGHARVWLVAAASFGPQVSQRLIPALAGAFRHVSMRDFAGVRVYLFETGTPPAR